MIRTEPEEVKREGPEARSGPQGLNDRLHPPLQNRVTPFGDIVAIAQRGALSAIAASFTIARR